MDVLKFRESILQKKIELIELVGKKKLYWEDIGWNFFLSYNGTI